MTDTLTKEDWDIIRRENLTPDLTMKIVADAVRFGYLTHLCLGGCGKTAADCGGCPCGSGLGWHPKLQSALNRA